MNVDTSWGGRAFSHIMSSEFPSQCNKLNDITWQEGSMDGQVRRFHEEVEPHVRLEIKGTNYVILILQPM